MGGYRLPSQLKTTTERQKIIVLPPMQINYFYPIIVTNHGWSVWGWLGWFGSKLVNAPDNVDYDEVKTCPAAAGNENTLGLRSCWGFSWPPVEVVVAPPMPKSTQIYSSCSPE